VTANPQQAHYETIHDEYAAHYYDPHAMAYREKYLFDRLLAGMDLNDLKIADVACGSGYNSLVLKRRFPRAMFHGFDISQRACDDYVRIVGSPASHLDMTVPHTFDETYDVVMVVGGLHHCVANLETTFDNIAKMLKPGGFLLFWEPNASFFLEGLRTFWYKHDRLFEEETERALSIDELVELAGPRFVQLKTFFFGGPAYIAIYNSLILRVPLGLKGILTPPLFAFETLWNKLPGRRPFPTLSGVWQRTQKPSLP
jgi:SAM-dependent methyltransferase